MKKHSTGLNMLWTRFFFRSILYLLIGLLVFVAGYKQSVVFMLFGGVLTIGGGAMLIVSLVSFVRWLVT